MRVQINIHGDKDVSGDGRDDIETMLRERLQRFDDVFTRLDVYINPNSAVHAGMEAFLCGIEARAIGKPPIKVHHAARRVDLAAEGAAVKLITATERRVARKRTVSRKGHAR